MKSRYTAKDLPRILAHDFALSEEGRCIADKAHEGLLQFYAMKVLPKTMYAIDTPEGVIHRNLVSVTAGGVKCLADQITGTLYLNGQCLTSNLRTICREKEAA